MSHEDQPVDRPLGDYLDEAGMLPSPSTVQNGEGSAPVMLPGATTQPEAMGGVDPFVLWAATSGKPLTSPPTPEPATRRPPVRRAKSDPRSRPRPAQQDRRKFVKLLAVGTAGLVTVVTVGGVSFARAPQSTTQSPSRIDDDRDDRSEGSTSIDAHSAHGERDDGDWGRSGRRPHKKPTPSKSPTPRPSPSPTQTQTPQPTMTPPPTPTGTVIGYTNQTTNSAVSFTNPADGQGSLLVHLSNGNFTAFERACTHQGVPVNYNAGTGQFLCPAHDAIFSATNGSHLSGPGNSPLATVSIHVNANGTITTP